jgi:hypothetical protein
VKEDSRVLYTAEIPTGEEKSRYAGKQQWRVSIEPDIENKNGPSGNREFVIGLEYFGRVGL